MLHNRYKAIKSRSLSQRHPCDWKGILSYTMTLFDRGLKNTAMKIAPCVCSSSVWQTSNADPTQYPHWTHGHEERGILIQRLHYTSYFTMVEKYSNQKTKVASYLTVCVSVASGEPAVTPHTCSLDSDCASTLGEGIAPRLCSCSPQTACGGILRSIYLSICIQSVLSLSVISFRVQIQVWFLHTSCAGRP